MTRTQLIIKKAEEIISGKPSGIRYSDLHKAIQAKLPKEKFNQITGALHKLRADLPSETVYMPARGLYKHVKFKLDSEGPETGRTSKYVPTPAEKEFYADFAAWLVEERQECTKAIALGGSKFKNKWGTPDVIGVRKHLESDILKPPIEVVSAEIKTNSKALIIAFGASLRV